MERVRQLGYLGLAVSDLGAWEDFGANVLGLEPERDGREGLRFRMDEYAQRFILERDGADDVRYLGWEVPDARALAAVAERIRHAGFEVSEGDPQEAAVRRVAGLVRATDPNGLASEIYYGAERCFERPFHSPRPISGFVTGEQGLGHVVLGVDHAGESLAFYRDALGLRESDLITMGRPGREVTVSFLHCNPRHHSVALVEARPVKRLNHFMVQVRSLDDVGAAYDLAQSREIPLSTTLGRHTNDHMVSFYMASPSGFDVEYGWGARTVDDATWTVQTHRSGSMWGHHRVKRS